MATEVLRGGAGGARWELAVRAAPAVLQRWLPAYHGYTEHTEGPLLRREFPFAGVVCVLELAAPIAVTEASSGVRRRHPGGFVAGLYEGYADCLHGGHQAGIQLDLTPLGARLLFGVPQSELVNRPVAALDLLPRQHRNLAERLADLPTWPQRFDLLDGVLLEVFTEATDRTRTVAWGVDRIHASGGRVDVASLARELGYSHTHLVRMFRDQVGVAPRQLSRLVRFQNLVERLKDAQPPPWAELAFTLGFCDQAHLAREVRRFAGITPTALRAAIRPGFGGDVDSVQDPREAAS